MEIFTFQRFLTFFVTKKRYNSVLASYVLGRVFHFSIDPVPALYKLVKRGFSRQISSKNLTLHKYICSNKNIGISKVNKYSMKKNVIVHMTLWSDVFQIWIRIPSRILSPGFIFKAKLQSA